MSFLAQGRRIGFLGSWGAGRTVTGRLCSTASVIQGLLILDGSLQQMFGGAVVQVIGLSEKSASHPFWVQCLQKSHQVRSTINKSEFLTRAWVWLREVLCVTCDNCLIIPLKLQLLNNKASNTNDRHTAESTENAMKHSKAALDGWEGSGSWVDCLERLPKIARYG